MSVTPASDDERFANHLEQAGSQLRADQLGPAEAEVASALALRPGDVRALNLRGLILFRAGRYEEAKQIFAELFVHKPEDMALCLNLGLVELRLGQNVEAARHLERVVAAEPNNQRVLGYLGLALMRKGDLDKAHELLVDAGQPELARQVEVLQKSATSGRLRRRSDGTIELDAPMVEAQRQTGTAVTPTSSAAEPVASFVGRTLVGDPTAEEPFWIGAGGDMLALRVDGRLATRMVGAVALTGQLTFEPLTRRVRGQATNEPVGQGAEALMSAVGHGRLLFAVDGSHQTLLKLDDDILYVREGLVFAFEDGGLVWESGRIPGGGAASGTMQFRGHGRVVVRTARPVVTIKADPEAALFVEPSRLVGWIGRVVPRHQAAADGAAAFVECTGEGVILLESGPSVAASTPVADVLEVVAEVAAEVTAPVPVAEDPIGPLE